jgi:hypothetical protein
VSYLRTANERAAYSRTFYQGTDEYVNKLGIRDQNSLEATERTFTDRRAAEGANSAAGSKAGEGAMMRAVVMPRPWD